MQEAAIPRPGSKMSAHGANATQPAFLVLSVILLVGSGLPVWAQSHHPDMVASPGRVHFPDGVDAVRFPLETSNGHIVLPVSINGSETLPVILDTGMPITGLTLFDHAQTGSVPLEFGPNRAQVGGAGGDGHHFEARVAEDVQLAIGEVKITGTHVIALPPVPGFPHDHAGIIGAELLDNFTVEVNQDRRELILWRPGAYKPGPDAAEVAFEMRNHLPFVNATLTGEDGRETPLSLVVDLGATHAVSLNVTSNDAIQLPSGAIEATIGRGLSGDVLGRVGRVRGLSLGSMKLENVVATFPEERHENPGGMDSRNGNLGMGVLSRFNLAVDYSRSRMYLEVSKRFEDPFEWDMSGMTLYPGEAEELVVSGIISGSPAEIAGLRKGDVLTAVDGESISGKDVARVKEILRNEGAVISVTYKRAGITDSVNLRLKRLI